MSKFKVWLKDDGTPDDDFEVEAFDAKCAAKEYAYERDSASADYIFATVGGQVIVRDESGKEETFHVQGYQEITYYARKFTGEVK